MEGQIKYFHLTEAHILACILFLQKVKYQKSPLWLLMNRFYFSLHELFKVYCTLVLRILQCPPQAIRDQEF